MADPFATALANRADPPPATKPRQWSSPGELAVAVDPSTVQTPALDLIDDSLKWAYSTRGARLIVSIGPQEGKSSRVTKIGSLWALSRDPERRIGIASYAQPLAEGFGRDIRNWISTFNGDEGTLDLGLRIAPDYGSAKRWQLDGHRGGIVCVGIGSGFTGRAAEALVVDDPFADMEQASSAYFRERVWSWWTSVATPRLAPGAPVILIMCMTGDTLVLMGNGTEKPLRDVRPGDTVATYEQGNVTTAVVRNWANQGPDSIYTIRMKSGAVVRANARHPFLTVQGGVETWQRTDMLKKGSLILRVTGGSGAEPPAPSMAATSPRNAKACACLTTTGSAGRTVRAPRRSTPKHAGMRAYATVTASVQPTTTGCLPSKADSALFAGNRRPGTTHEPTGTGSSASITAMTPDGCAACSAMTATLSSATGEQKRTCGPQPTTYVIEADEVIEVVPCGVEDVYDLQVDRTENFIANGLVSHNTRWHEDDLAGRLVKAEDGHRWRVVNIPALADHKPEEGQSDPLGREPGQWLESARGRTPAEWEQIRISVGTRVFTALYQGRPSPDQGNVWLRQWWRRYQVPLWSQHPDVPGAYLVHDVDEVIMSWDMAFKDTKSSDWVVGQVWARRGANVYLLDQVRKRLSFTDTLIAFAALVARWPQATRKLVEDKANGTAVLSTLKSKIPGMVAVNPTDSKYGRATAVAPFIEAGNAFLPEGGIALFDPEELITEAAGFPNAAHDDQVDATSQALSEMLLDGNGAQAWLNWAKRKAEEAARARGELPPEPAAPEPEPGPADAPVSPGDGGTWRVRSSDGQRDYVIGPDGRCPCQAGMHGQRCRHVAEAVVAGAKFEVPLSPAEIRRQARNEAFRAQQGNWR